jgi:hypothetical protein
MFGIIIIFHVHPQQTWKAFASVFAFMVTLVLAPCLTNVP